MELHGKKVVLRAVEEEDIEMLREMTNNPDFEKMILGWSFPVSKKQQREWFENCKNQSSSVRYTIAIKEDRQAVGRIGLSDIDWKNGVASVSGICIAKSEMRKRGLATDAWMTLLRYAFEELRLNRVNASVLVFNKASLRACEKSGFKVEGQRRQAFYKNGEYIDVVMLGCLKSDYEELISENHYWDD